MNFYLLTQVLIQLGDILDRGEEEIAILSLLRSLDIQAKAKGGAVFQVCPAKKIYMLKSQVTVFSCDFPKLSTLRVEFLF